MLFTFIGEYALKEKSARRSWTLMFNAAVQFIDKLDRIEGLQVIRQNCIFDIVHKTL